MYVICSFFVILLLITVFFVDIFLFFVSVFFNPPLFFSFVMSVGCESFLVYF